MNEENRQLIALQEPEKKLTERKIAYVMNDKYFQGFEVLYTSWGWWKERSKLEIFINCFKQGYNIHQACIYTGISKEQWNTFKELHPNIYAVIERCEQAGKMMVETNIHAFIQEKDKETTRWYAERRIPEKYGRNLAMGEDGGQVINNFGTIIAAPLSQRSKPIPESVMERLNKQNE